MSEFFRKELQEVRKETQQIPRVVFADLDSFLTLLKKLDMRFSLDPNVLRVTAMQEQFGVIDAFSLQERQVFETVQAFAQQLAEKHSGDEEYTRHMVFRALSFDSLERLQEALQTTIDGSRGEKFFVEKDTEKVAEYLPGSSKNRTDEYGILQAMDARCLESIDKETAGHAAAQYYGRKLKAGKTMQEAVFAQIVFSPED